MSDLILPAMNLMTLGTGLLGAGIELYRTDRRLKAEYNP
jgi:hypothetical protein